MDLTFKNGAFILQNLPPGWKPNKENQSYWSQYGIDGFFTTSLRHVLPYKKLADSKAARVLERALVKRYPDQDWALPKYLDAHQKDGVRWILTRSRSYLAHAPGAGKTLEAITASTLCEDIGQTLFIVPPSLTLNWAREIEKFRKAEMPSVAIVPKSNAKHNMDWDADFIICPDSMLTRDWVLNELIRDTFKFIAIDEASRFKESNAKRTVALFGGKSGDFSSPGLIYKARHVVLLDGSPMPNRPMELWAPTYAMSPESIDFMNQFEFGMKYCGPTMNNFGKWEFKYSSNEKELKEKMQESFMHVVGEESLNHPERLRSILFMSEDPRTSAHKAWDKKNLSKINFAEIDEEQNGGELATWRKELGLSKVDWITRYVMERLSNKNESILLFAWHREVCEDLYRRLNYQFPNQIALVIGGTREGYREKAFRDFQNGKLKLIVGNIAAMGRGHNLQRADRIIFGEFSWTDEMNKQCEKRASRRGRAQNAFVRCEYIVAPNTIDEPVLGAVFTKAMNVKRIIG